MSAPKFWTPTSDARSEVASPDARVFALNASGALGRDVATALGITLSPHEEREFEDGEHKVRPLIEVSGCDVYVIQSLHGSARASPNDKLCRLLFFIGALKDAGACRVTAVVPYMCYARKDRRTKSRDPLTTRYVAALFEAVGTDVVATLEVHNPAAFENAFRCRAVALPGMPLFIDTLCRLPEEKLCIVSPDTGGAKRAEMLRERLETMSGRPIGNAFAEKYRSGGVVSGELFVGDVAGATAIIVDDLISTGGTLVRAARSARKAGAKHVIALATHGLFSSGAADALADPALDRILVTDTTSDFQLPSGVAKSKTEVVPSAPLLAALISRLNGEKSLEDLGVF